MTKVNKDPRISVNKLGEYMTSKAARQHQILRGQKYPPEYITTYYREAQEAISSFIADNMEDMKILERQIQILDQQSPDSVQKLRRLEGNIEAIERFMTLIDDIDMKGAAPILGNPKPPKMQIMNVEVSVRPEIILHASGSKGKTLVGGIKLHFPKTNPLNEDGCGYISAIMQMYIDNFHQDDGVPSAKHCLTIDVASGKVYEGVTAITQRKKDIEAACQQINTLWPSIKN